MRYREGTIYLRSQFAISNTENAPTKGGRRYLPYAFSEQGIAMLSAVLRSDEAIQVSVNIMNALSLTTQHKEFYPLIKKAFMDAGVIFVILPDISGSKINGDYGISFEKETSEQEAAADKYAEDCLIPPKAYKQFVSSKQFSLHDIRRFPMMKNLDK